MSNLKKKWPLPEGLNVCVNYEFNLLDHVGVVAKAGGVRRVDKINMAAVASGQHQ